MEVFGACQPGCQYQSCFSVPTGVSQHRETSEQRKLLPLRTTKMSLPVHPSSQFPDHDLYHREYTALKTNFREAGRRVGPALLLRGGRQPRAGISGGSGRLNVSLTTPASPLQRNARLTFAFVAASSFSSHAFSTVANASIAFQFFSRRSCQDHTQRAISHTSRRRPPGCLLALWRISKPPLRKTGSSPSLLSRVFHPTAHACPFLLHPCSGPMHRITQAVALREQSRAGWRQELQKQPSGCLELPGEDTGQVEGCKVASTQLIPPCSRGLRSRGTMRCEGPLLRDCLDPAGVGSSWLTRS